jgi:hypothetical protein
LALLAGCSASAEPGPEAAWTHAAVDGQCLDAAGVTTPVAGAVCFPADATLDYTYGADKTLIALGPEAEGAAVLAYLEANLPVLGWEVTATGEAALRFARGEWQGSFAIGDGQWGLTVRAE